MDESSERASVLIPSVDVDRNRGPSRILDMSSPSSADAILIPISVAANTASILSCDAAMKNAAKYPKSKPTSLGAMPSHRRS